MKNLIIADDSFTVKKVIEMLLKPLGYNLIFTENGEKTLNSAKSSSVDAVILDFSLPDRNSAEISREIKKLNPNLPVMVMFNGKEHSGDKILSICQCDEIIEKPFDSQTFLSKIDNLKSKTEIKSQKPEKIEPVEIDLAKGEEIKEKSIEESLELDFGQEFTIKEKDEKANLEELDLGQIEVEELEELEELKDIEELEVEELKIDESQVTKKEEITDTVSLEDLLGEEIVMEEISQEKEVLEQKPEKKEEVFQEVAKETKLEEPTIDINEFFSDLNEILVEKEKPSVEKIFGEKKVKPVVEEVAKELKEMEEIVSSEEDLDIWDFEIPTEKEVQETVKEASVISEERKADQLSIDRKELEKIIKEITYEVIEKVAWEVVPEIVDTILKDKFPKR